MKKVIKIKFLKRGHYYKGLQKKQLLLISKENTYERDIINYKIALFFSFITAYGQSNVSEIRWVDSESTTYTGLLVLYPNNTGVFKVKFYHPSVGWVWIYQKAKLTNQFDNYGNCTSFINCSYPQASPNVPYSADNFIVYPNGAMYTQDYSGKWSTQIVSVVIA